MDGLRRPSQSQNRTTRGSGSDPSAVPAGGPTDASQARLGKKGGFLQDSGAAPTRADRVRLAGSRGGAKGWGGEGGTRGTIGISEWEKSLLGRGGVLRKKGRRD